MKHYTRPDKGGTCYASLPNGDVCLRHTGGSFQVCKRCNERIHSQMMRMLYAYGQAELALQLETHWQLSHRPDRRGMSCGECSGVGRRPFDNPWPRAILTAKG